VASFEVEIDQGVLARMPGLRLTALVFGGARIGMPTRKIEPIREKVIAAARERITAARDVRRIPSLAAFHQAFPECLRGTRKPWLDEMFRGIARRDPFPVANDIVDPVRLLAIHYAVPIAAVDLSKVRSPLALAIAAPGTTGKIASGAPIDVGGLPVLRDSAGPAACPFIEIHRALPGRTTSDFAVIVFEPGADGPVDHADLENRAQNWLSTLVGARLAGTITRPA
jgi:DNA/RNA-binding domain of Phe-tRNA-synthetase-like protein